MQSELRHSSTLLLLSHTNPVLRGQKCVPPDSCPPLRSFYGWRPLNPMESILITHVSNQLTPNTESWVLNHCPRGDVGTYIVDTHLTWITAFHPSDNSPRQILVSLSYKSMSCTKWFCPVQLQNSFPGHSPLSRIALESYLVLMLVVSVFVSSTSDKVTWFHPIYLYFFPWEPLLR